MANWIKNNALSIKRESKSRPRKTARATGSDFPPNGLIAYGDASIDLDNPVKENFFAIDFAAFEKADQTVPRRVYMRIVPIDDQGQAVGETSNAVRIDRP